MQRPNQDSHDSPPSAQSAKSEAGNIDIADHVGESLAGFRVESRVGEGPGSHVFLAREERTGKEVAAYIFAPSLVADRAQVELFFEEAQVATAARNAGILDTLEVGFASDGAPFQIVERFTGKTLQDALVPGQPFSVARALAIAEQLAAALSAAHFWGLVHGALSPKTVIVGDDDRVKIIGFGMSKLEPMRNARAPRFFGVADYMAPEQIDDPTSADARSDIYSLGALLYAMLIGGSPFAKIEPTQLLRFISKEDPKKLRDVRPELRVSLGKVVNRAMRRVRDERYMEMQELIDALAPLERDPREPERASNPTLSAQGSSPAIPGKSADVALAATMTAPVTPAIAVTPAPIPTVVSATPSPAAGPPSGALPAAVPTSTVASPVAVSARAEVAPAREFASAEKPAKKRVAAIWLVPAALIALVGVGVVSRSLTGTEPAAKSETTMAAGTALTAPPGVPRDPEPAPPAKPTQIVATKDPSPPPMNDPPARPANPNPNPNPNPNSNPRAVAPVAPPPRVVSPPAPVAAAPVRRGAPTPASNPAPIAANPTPPPATTPSAPKKRTSADLEPY